MDRIVVLGRPTCEDTMVTESRFRALGVPFESRNIEADPDAERELLARNDGNRVTPTLVIGEGERERVVTEPSLESLRDLLAAVGHGSGEPPRATPYHGAASATPLPRLVRLRGDLPRDPRGGAADTWNDGSGAVVAFVAHGQRCMACLGYARQLARQIPALAGEDATLAVLVPDAATAEGWRHELDEAVALVADEGGRWSGAARARAEASPENALLIVLDRFGAPAAGLAAGEAGGLPDPVETVDWARFLGLERPEGTDELDWR